MRVPFKDHERHVVPRWRPVDSSLRLAEGEALRSQSTEESNSDKILARRRADFEEAPGQGTAGDLLSVAVTGGRTEVVRDVARQLIEAGEPLPVLLEQAAYSAVGRSPTSVLISSAGANYEGPSETEPRRIFVQRARRALARHARNPYLWLELARQHTILGELEKAGRELSIARSLAPEDRLILRSASRYFLHTGEKEKAAWLLSTAENVRRDPWLLAAEIATTQAAGKTSRNIKVAESLLSREIPAERTTELAAAVASVELEAGSAKAARRLFSRALEAPNENSFSQAVWAHHTGGLSGFDFSSGLYLPENFEGPAIDSYFNGDWSSSLRSAVRWQEQEPFSSRPSILGSFVASMLLKNETVAEEMLRISLRARPEDPMLLNNLAFVLAITGRLDEADRRLQKARTAPDAGVAEVQLRATEGLLRLKRGDIDRGLSDYKAAIDLAIERKDRLSAAVGLVLLAGEVAGVDQDAARVLREKLSQLVPELGRLEQLVVSAVAERFLSEDLGAGR